MAKKKVKEIIAHNIEETLDDIMCEAFAVAREAARRVIGEYPYFCQLEGAAVLH